MKIKRVTRNRDEYLMTLGRSYREILDEITRLKDEANRNREMTLLMEDEIEFLELRPTKNRKRIRMIEHKISKLLAEYCDKYDRAEALEFIIGIPQEIFTPEEFLKHMKED